MFTVWGRQHRHCDRLARREFLRVGAVGMGGLSLADLLRTEASAATTKRPVAGLHRLGGGPSHIDTWDPKPEAVDIAANSTPSPRSCPACVSAS
jgi:hypothetical protein